MSRCTVTNIRLGEPYDVYVGRAGHGRDGTFGSPFPVESESRREETISRYREYFLARVESDLEFRRRALELRGKVLGCFCVPWKSCHASVIAAWVNKQFPDDVSETEEF